MGVVGCLSCIVGSVIIVIHAPQEHTPDSVEEIWDLATQPGKDCFLCISFNEISSSSVLNLFFLILQQLF